MYDGGAVEPVSEGGRARESFTNAVPLTDFKAWARHQVLGFLRPIQPRDRVAVYSMGRGGLRILPGYTTEASSPIERLNRWFAQAEPDLAASEGPLANPGGGNEVFPLGVCSSG